MSRLIFHIDVNSAFLSWESARRVKQGLSDLRDIPACIGGDPKKRTGIVVAKSIPAKKYGITTGEPVAMALRKCPELVIVKSDFELYIKCSRAFKEICASYAPVMESFSIDEVFLDMTGTSLIYPDPIKTAHEIKDKIRDELGFTVNVGISTNKLLAKMASDFEKPDKVHTLFPEEIPTKMWPLSVRDLLFLGKAFEKKLTEAGIRTIGDMAHVSESEIQALLGNKAGHQLHQYALGIDESPVKAKPEEAKGFSVETTFNDDIVSVEQVLPILLEQCDVVTTRMRRKGKKCTSVSVTFRTLDFKNKSHQTTLSNATDMTDEIFRNAKTLYRILKGEPLRLIGVALTNLTDESFEQLSLFEDNEKKERHRKLDATMDEIRQKFGNDKITRASIMNSNSGIARKARAQMKNELEISCGKQAEKGKDNGRNI
ncbi:MAG: DNA polymerase thumb domain-containing protein [Blautia obeum]